MFRIEKFSKLDTMGANVLKAMLPFVSKEETRYVLMNVNVRGIWIEATDGHRAIRFLKSRLGVKDNIPNGLYTVAKEGQDLLLIPSRCDGQFPNLDVIIPKKWRREFRAYTAGKKSTGEVLFKLARAGVRMDARLVDELPSDTYTVGVSKPIGPVMFHGSVYEIVLMPMRGEKGRVFEFGTFGREAYEEEAEEAARAAAVAEDVDRLNAALEAGPAETRNGCNGCEKPCLPSEMDNPMGYCADCLAAATVAAEVAGPPLKPEAQAQARAEVMQAPVVACPGWLAAMKAKEAAK